MSAPHRNDPCPCGSGKKYEECCQKWYESATSKYFSAPRLVDKKRVVQEVYKDILPAENPDDKAFVDIFQGVSPYTLTSRSGADTLYGLFNIIKYLVHNKIPGDIVECGVWRGGSMMMAALALKYFDDTRRQIYMYDTYAGMTEPDDIDVDFDGRAMKPIWANAERDGIAIGYGGSLEDVKANLRQTGYPESQMHFIAGDVMETIPAILPKSIALLRLDTDWYKSTLHELQHLYGLLVPNGVLIIDDYGWCRGARQATDEFFHNQPFTPLMHRVNETVRVLMKPGI